MTDTQFYLAYTLHRRKTRKPDSQITLTDEEYQILVSEGTEGLEQSREMLAAIGIILP